MLSVFPLIKQRVCLGLHAFQERVLRWFKALTTSLVLATFADLTRGKAELLAENALLRKPLIILHRQIKRPMYKKTDRLLLVFLVLRSLNTVTKRIGLQRQFTQFRAALIYQVDLRNAALRTVRYASWSG